MRVAIELLASQAHLLGKLGRALPEPSLAAFTGDMEGLGDQPPYSHAGIERRLWILENDLELAARPAQRLGIGDGEVNALEDDPARRGRLKGHDNLGQCRFSAP